MHTRWLTVPCIALVLLAACAPIGLPATTPAPGRTTPASTSPSPRMAESPEAAYRAYFEAMRDNDFEEAVRLLSDYSLRTEGWTREDVREQLRMGMFGALRFLDVEILDVQRVSPETAIIHDRVTTQQALTPRTTREQWNVARLEEGGWRVNANDLVDATSIDWPAHTRNGVTVRLREVRRYSKGARLIFDVNNANEETAWWGEAGKLLLRLGTDSDTVEVEGGRLRFDAHSTYPNITVEAGHSLGALPTSVELHGWMLAGSPASWSYRLPA